MAEPTLRAMSWNPPRCIRGKNSRDAMIPATGARAENSRSSMPSGTARNSAVREPFAALRAIFSQSERDTQC